jgi:hypothetical protein
MNLIEAINREEAQVEKQMRALQHRLHGLRSAKQALADSLKTVLGQPTSRVLSAEARAKISAAARRRWAKVRARGKKKAA